MLDQVQFTLIHGLNIPRSCPILFFTASVFTFTTRHINNQTSFPLWTSCFIFLELFAVALHSSSVAYWTPSNLWVSSSGVIIFWSFHTFHGVVWQEYWSGFPFPSPVDHVFSELFTMTCLSWVALHGMTHIFIELCKTLHHDKVVIHEAVHLVKYSFINNSLIDDGNNRICFHSQLLYKNEECIPCIK